jgi:hypothetical protein
MWAKAPSPSSGGAFVMPGDRHADPAGPWFGATTTPAHRSRPGGRLACRDAVIAEIERAEFLAAEVREALAGCARHRTPDLAFRVLLSTMVNDASDRSLSPERYARMETIKSALLYGEFVVDSVEFLVEQESPPVSARPSADD